MQNRIDLDIKALNDPDVSPFRSIEDIVHRLLPFNVVQHPEEDDIADIESAKGTGC